MKTRIALIVLVGISLAFGSAWSARADEADAKAAEEQAAKIKEVLEEAVNWYDVLPDAEAKARMQPQVVLRWQNAVRVQTGAAVLALWTDHGRPEAMASIFQTQDQICHEFGSLSRANKLVVRDKNAVVWSPKKPGLEFRDVPDSPAPAESPAARLRQMKAISERFSARLSSRLAGGDLESLRLLPRPLYRYELKESKDADPSLLDGVMFAFVMGTDPEVILLLEAVKRGNHAVWQYALSRATSYPVEAALGNAVVWSESNEQVVSKPTSALFQIFRPMP